MFIEYSEEQNMLRDSAERYLRDNYSFDSRQAAVKQASGFDAVQWQAFADLGWLAMTFDEDSGGFGGGALETMILCEQFGKFLVLEPYLESVVMVGGLIEAGAQPAIKEQYLTGLIAGELQGAFAYLEEGSVADPTHVKTVAEPSGEGFILNGTKTVVLNGPEADFFIVSVSTGANHDDSRQGISLFVVGKDNPGLSLNNYKTYDGRSASELRLTDVAVSNLALVGELDNGFAIAAPIFSRAIVAVCAEAVGAMDALLAATVDYTKQRKQFGQSISGFQVLRHRMVDMFMEYEQCKSMLYRATMESVQDPIAAQRTIHGLKHLIGKSGLFVGENAVQLHGGMGVTEELRVGHFFKRLLVIDSMFGNADHHLQKFTTY